MTPLDGGGANSPPLAPWLEALRARLMAVARRRVPLEAAEDLVQDAMLVILERGVRVGTFDTVDGLPPLVWSLQVMRNVIGNFYQKARTRERNQQDVGDDTKDPAWSLTPLDFLESDESMRVIHEAIGTLGTGEGKCGSYLEKLARGEGLSKIAQEEQLQPMVLYRRLYRCRLKLRAILVRKGVLP